MGVEAEKSTQDISIETAALLLRNGLSIYTERPLDPGVLIKGGTEPSGEMFGRNTVPGRGRQFSILYQPQHFPETPFVAIVDSKPVREDLEDEFTQPNTESFATLLQAANFVIRNIH